LRLIDFVYHSTLGLIVIKKKKKKKCPSTPNPAPSTQKAKGDRRARISGRNVTTSNK